MEVEPTEPRAFAPANCPTTATSAILKSTCSKLENINGRLNLKICAQRFPWVKSCTCFFIIIPQNVNTFDFHAIILQIIYKYNTLVVEVEANFNA